MASCRIGHVARFRGQDQLQTYTLYQTLKAAQFLQIPCLEEDLAARIDNIIDDKQVHSEDIKVIYREFAKGHELRARVADHIAKLWWNGQLNGGRYYKNLANEVPDFGVDIDERWDKLTQAYHEQIRAEEEEERLYQRKPVAFEIECIEAERQAEAIYARTGSAGGRGTGKLNN